MALLSLSRSLTRSAKISSIFDIEVDDNTTLHLLDTIRGIARLNRLLTSTFLTRPTNANNALKIQKPRLQQAVALLVPLWNVRWKSRDDGHPRLFQAYLRLLEQLISYIGFSIM